MVAIEISLETKSPLSIGTAKAYGGTLIESGSYVRGGHLRGALAAVKPYLNKEESEQIEEVLGRGGAPDILLPNCYPALYQASFPLPLTAYSCKSAEAGFRAERHGVVDTLIPRLAYDCLADPWDKRNIPVPYRFPTCAKCGRRTEPFDGFAERIGDRQYLKSQVFRRRQTRVAINRRRLTHEESQLYSVSAIDTGTVFIGMATVDPARVQLLFSCLGLIERLGGRSSRGFGRVAVSARRIPSPRSVADRVRLFNDKYQSVLMDFSAIAIAGATADVGTSLFAVTLRSDAILRTIEGLPTTELSADALKSELVAAAGSEQDKAAIDAIDIALVSQHTRSIIVSGWNIKWRLPKETLLASRMGGVYVYEAAVTDDQRVILNESLARLEQRGVGEFREDGYGQIRICDEFHTEVEPV